MKIICKICSKECQGYRGLTSHLRKHKIKAKQYYDKYLKVNDEDVCNLCKKETDFISLEKGYEEFCSKKCEQVRFQLFQNDNSLKGTDITDEQMKLYEEKIIKDVLLNKLEKQEKNNSVLSEDSPQFNSLETKVLKNMLNEKLEKEILQKHDPSKQKNMSQTSEYKDVIKDLGIDVSNTVYELYKQHQASEMIPVWRRLSTSHIEIQEALEEITNESVVVDTMSDIMAIDFNDDDKKIPDSTKTKISDEWKYLYSIMDLDNNLEQLFRNFFIEGTMLLEAVYDNKKITDGIQYVVPIDPVGILKKYSKEIHKYVYVKTDDNSYNDFSSFRQKDQKVWLSDQISESNSGLWDGKNKIPLSFLNFAIKPLNQLNAIENSLVIYAITRSVEKLIFYIDVDDMPEPKVKQKVAEIAKKMSTQSKYNQSTGRIENTKDKINLSRDIFVPHRGDQKGMKIEELSASSMDINGLPILEYFLDKVYRSLRVPRLRRNKEGATMQFGESQEVEREEINFFKFVVKLRKQFSFAFKDLMKKQLICKNIINEEEWKGLYSRAIKFKFADNNDYAELKRVAKLRSRLDLLNEIKEFTIKDDENGEIIIFTKDFVMRDILNLSDDQITQLEKQMEIELKTQQEKIDANKEKMDAEEVEEDFSDIVQDFKLNNDIMVNDESDQEIYTDLSELEFLLSNAEIGDEVIEPKSETVFVVAQGEDGLILQEK